MPTPLKNAGYAHDGRLKSQVNKNPLDVEMRPWYGYLANIVRRESQLIRGCSKQVGFPRLRFMSKLNSPWRFPVKPSIISYCIQND